MCGGSRSRLHNSGLTRWWAPSRPSGEGSRPRGCGARSAVRTSTISSQRWGEATLAWGRPATRRSTSSRRARGSRERSLGRSSTPSREPRRTTRRAATVAMPTRRRQVRRLSSRSRGEGRRRARWRIYVSWRATSAALGSEWRYGALGLRRSRRTRTSLTWVTVATYSRGRATRCRRRWTSSRPGTTRWACTRRRERQTLTPYLAMCVGAVLASTAPTRWV